MKRLNGKWRRLQCCSNDPCFVAIFRVVRAQVFLHTLFSLSLLSLSLWFVCYCVPNTAHSAHSVFCLFCFASLFTISLFSLFLLFTWIFYALDFLYFHTDLHERITNNEYIYIFTLRSWAAILARPLPMNTKHGYATRFFLSYFRDALPFQLRRLLRLLVSLLCLLFRCLPYIFTIIIFRRSFFFSAVSFWFHCLISRVSLLSVLFFCFYFSVSSGCLNWAVWGTAGDGILSQQIEFVAFVCTRNFLFHLCERVEWKKSEEENKQKPFNWSAPTMEMKTHSRSAGNDQRRSRIEKNRVSFSSTVTLLSLFIRMHFLRLYCCCWTRLQPTNAE